MAYFDQHEHDNTDAGIFYEYLETQEGPLPTTVEDLFFQYSCYHTGITPSTSPYTSLALLHALRRLGIIKSWRDQDILWTTPRAIIVERKDSQLDAKLTSCNIQDPQQRTRTLRPRQNRAKNQWRPITGVLDIQLESQINNPVTRDREENLWKSNINDGDEEIVWSGREKLPEASQGLGMENLTIHENSRGIISKNTSPRGSIRRASISYKGPTCGPYIVPIPGPSYLVPLATPLYKENKDGFGENPIDLQNKGRFKENQDFHKIKLPHHESRVGPRVEKKGFGGWHPQPQLQHFATSNDFLALPSIPYYPGQEKAPELIDPFFVGPPCYDYSSYHSGQYAPGFDFLGVHTTNLDNDWRSLYGYPIPTPKFAYDNSQASNKQHCNQAYGGQVIGKRGHRGGRTKKIKASQNIQAGKGKGRANRNNKREDSSFTILNVGEGFIKEVRTKSENSNSIHNLGLNKRQWKASQEAGKDIFVSQPFSPSHDRPQTINVGATEGASIAVVNNGIERIKLLAVKMLYSSPKGSFSLSLAPPSRAPSSTEKNAPVIDVTKSILKSQNGILPGGPWIIVPGFHLTFKLGCTALAMGLHKAILLFDFGTQKIVRYITLLCEDEIAKAMAPIEPYIRLPCPRIQSFYKFVPGIPPPLPFFKKRLEFYPMPPNIKEAILKKETLSVFIDGLSKKNYFEYFSTLVFAEELQMEVDIRAYDMQNVTMWKVSHAILGLHVPGLAERRPSVIYRDKIYVRPSGTTSREFQGYVHKVQAREVHLRFSDVFHKNFISNSRYDIRFSFGRVNIRRAHQGIQAAKVLLDSFIFPSTPIPIRAEPSKKFIPFNRDINAEQKSAISEILKRKGAPPYLIYGPPGTGKTVTVVEAILQVRRFHPNAHILACAPSNSASDLLLERLSPYVEKRDMLRLNAYTRSIEEVSKTILSFCLVENNFFYTPDQASLMKYRIVVTTYWSAAMLDAQEVQPGHFTHIFLDEAGQGTESEAMVPIGNLANSNTVVVLAGDHQQLGPLIRSPVALKYGLDKSYLERLSTLTTYLPASANGKSLVYNNNLVTKLVRNYRSHPAILDLPSRLFYDGELMACADESRNSLVEWDELPNKRFPVLFIGIEGRDEREGTSPSWFNAQEASKVIDIVIKVKDYRRNRVTLNDIGVISLYNQQVSKLKKAFASQNLGEVKVGSVESFQGQEKRVIIISTVRSSKEHVEFDKKHNLGFLTNPKRFNVAITRAKALLIIVGNPHVLSQDRCWNELLQYCLENNSYIGCTPPSDEINEENKQLHSKINNENWFDAEEISTNNDDLSASFKATVEDLQWPDGTC